MATAKEMNELYRKWVNSPDDDSLLTRLNEEKDQFMRRGGRVEILIPIETLNNPRATNPKRVSLIELIGEEHEGGYRITIERLEHYHLNELCFNGIDFIARAQPLIAPEAYYYGTTGYYFDEEINLEFIEARPINRL